MCLSRQASVLEKVSDGLGIESDLWIPLCAWQGCADEVANVQVELHNCKLKVRVHRPGLA